MATKSPVFVLKPTFKPAEIQSAYDKVLASVAANFESKGFRKGKAPISVVKDHISEGHLIEEVITSLVSKYYSQEVSTQDLHPIIQPQIKVLNPPLELGKEWQIEITGCELPKINLKAEYKEEIKKINTSVTNENERLNQTIACLLKNSSVDLPDILVTSDVENKLAQLVDQTKEAGLTINAYLKSKNTTLEKYRTELTTQIQQEWITNLAIDFIARENKLDVSQQEVDEVISKNKELAKNLNLVYYLLTQQKVFALLKSF